VTARASMSLATTAKDDCQRRKEGGGGGKGGRRGKGSLRGEMATFVRFTFGTCQLQTQALMSPLDVDARMK
jgi:hypothetical protein